MPANKDEAECLVLAQPNGCARKAATGWGRCRFRFFPHTAEC